MLELLARSGSCRDGDSDALQRILFGTLAAFWLASGDYRKSAVRFTRAAIADQFLLGRKCEDSPVRRLCHVHKTMHRLIQPQAFFAKSQCLIAEPLAATFEHVIRTLRQLLGFSRGTYEHRQQRQK